MANSRDSGEFKEYATVNSLPDAEGYFTNSVCIRDLQKSKKIDKIFFSIRETEAFLSAAPSALSEITVALQFTCDGDDGWQDYVPLDGSELAVGNRIVIEDVGAAVHWRAGVVSDGYTSGSVTFGFDW